MSRIGNKKISIDNKIKLEIKGNNLNVSGTKGNLNLDIPNNINVSFSDTEISVSVNDKKDKKQKELHGLMRSLINNMVTGVSVGFEKSLTLQGIGYKVQQKGKNLIFSLGYSHPVNFDCPDSVEFEVINPTEFKVKSIDKQKLGQVCAEIKSLRKRDAYKGKGIHFVGDQIKKKPGKTVKK
ncbi:50S ribosomal protein L6 [Candidatus Marinamargulisbacteria bacterium SCGC AG-410-N11]|nr:50S ribosomal protein L6 [Candidatus Marinamargulisbacteria bacterium SCGC AG-410-N11]